MKNKILNSINISIIFITLIISITIALGIPYAWNVIHLSKRNIFTWEKLGWGILIWIIISPIIIVYFKIKNPKIYSNKFNNFMNKKYYKNIIEKYNYDSENYKAGFMLKTNLKNKKLDISLLKEKGNALAISSNNSEKINLLIDPQIRILGKSINKPSIIITDINGELFKKHGWWLQNKGYEILNINLRDEKYYSKWNPIEKIWKAWKINNENSKEKSKLYLSELSMKLFDNYELSNLFQFFVLAIMEISDNNSKIDLNSFNINNILNNLKRISKKELKLILSLLPYNSLAIQALNARIKTEEEIEIILNKFTEITIILKEYQEHIIKIVSSGNSMKINSNKSQAIFIILPNETKDNGYFVPLLISDLYTEIIDINSKSKNHQLKKSFYFILNEFDGINKIKNIDKILNNSISENIYFMLFTKSYKNLYKIYEENVVESIINNCSIEYYIFANDIDTVKKFSKRISPLQQNKHLHENKSQETINYEIMNLEYSEIIIKIKRQKPIRIRTSEFYKFSKFNYGNLLLHQNFDNSKYNKKYLKLFFTNI